MGRRGPKPTHPSITKLTGNPGKRAIPSVVPAVGSVECPAHLSEDAQTYWAQIISAMPPDFYAPADLAVLAAFCEAAALHKRAILMIREDGEISTGPTGAPYQSPWVSILNTQTKIIATLGDRLGLSPAARVGLKVERSEKPKSKFEGLIAIQGGRKQ